MAIHLNGAQFIPAERFLPYLSWQQVRDLHPSSVLVLPVASTEQHGPHLPLFTDVLVGQILLGAALARLPHEAPVYALPPIVYGRANEHRHFPGTIVLASELLYRILMDVARSVRAWGPGYRLVFWNSHGGNRPVVEMVARDARDETGLRTFMIGLGNLGLGAELAPQERQLGLHAGDLETSILLAACAELVQLDRAVAEYPAVSRRGGHDSGYGFEASRGVPIFAWLTHDLSDSGVIGDPSMASAEKGARWISAAADKLVELLLSALAWQEPKQTHRAGDAHP